MNRSTMQNVACAIVVGCALSPPCAGVPFDYPPEFNFPGWETQYPYQRNIFLEFEVDPTGGPFPSGIPGAVYDGTDDASLWDGDSITITGDTAWALNPPVAAGDVGAIFTDRRSASTGSAGSKEMVVKNKLTINPMKHIVYTATYLTSSAIDIEDYKVKLSVDLSAPAEIVSAVRRPILSHSVPGGFTRTITEWDITIRPNVPSEKLTLMWVVPRLGYFALETAHTATECVPSSGPVALLIGAGLLGALRRRR